MYELVLQLALADVAPDEPAFVLARLDSPRCSAALAKPLADLASRFVGGMDVVLVQRAPDGDLRQFGPHHLISVVAKLDLDTQPWTSVVISSPVRTKVA